MSNEPEDTTPIDSTSCLTEFEEKPSPPRKQLRLHDFRTQEDQTANIFLLPRFCLAFIFLITPLSCKMSDVNTIINHS